MGGGEPTIGCSTFWHDMEKCARSPGILSVTIRPICPLLDIE